MSLAGAVAMMTAVGVVAAAFIAWAYRRTSAALASMPPYREVTERHTDETGSEIVTLECGHRLRLTYQRRQSLPCECCREEAH